MITVPEGKYVGRAKAWGWCKAGTGIDQIAVLFEFKTRDEIKRLTWYGFANSEENAKRTMSTMRTCGWDGLGPVTEAQGLDANEVQIVIEDDYYRPEGDSKIKYVNSLSDLRIKELTPDQKQALNAKLAQWQKQAHGLRDSKPRVTPVQQPAESTQSTQSSDDDIPF